jgi:trans-aconitate 2-methyltransferase
MEENQKAHDSHTISAFYDDYKSIQEDTGVNLRHYMAFNWCLIAGLKSNHKVLEIGCGIGTFTGLLAAYISSGKIVATDISGQSIEIAKKRVNSPGKVEFYVSDMKNFHVDCKFDFVLMIDVLEHIPFDQYDQLFKTIECHLSDQGILAINVPHPEALQWVRDHEPQRLQIIDNPVQMDYLSKHTYANNLKLVSYSTFSIFHEEIDYAFIILSKKGSLKTLTRIALNKVRILKIIFRIRYQAALWFRR